MPYITKEKRPELDRVVDELRNVLRNYELDDPDSNNTEGNINYVFTKLLMTVYSPTRYQHINDVVGLLECVKLEYYRVVAAPYEEEKSEDNGPVC
jgi:hypothetical protein